MQAARLGARTNRGSQPESPPTTAGEVRSAAARAARTSLWEGLQARCLWLSVEPVGPTRSPACVPPALSACAPMARSRIPRPAPGKLRPVRVGPLPDAHRPDRRDRLLQAGPPSARGAPPVAGGGAGCVAWTALGWRSKRADACSWRPVATGRAVTVAVSLPRWAVRPRSRRRCSACARWWRRKTSASPGPRSSRRRGCRLRPRTRTARSAARSRP